MQSIHQFLDYIDSRGSNPVAVWLHAIPKKARIKLNERILDIEELGELKMPYGAQLKREAKGLLQIRADVENLQYRLIGTFGPENGDVTLLVGSTKKGSQYNPSNVFQLAKNRKAEIGIKGRTCEHKISEPT